VEIGWLPRCGCWLIYQMRVKMLACGESEARQMGHSREKRESRAKRCLDLRFTGVTNRSLRT